VRVSVRVRVFQFLQVLNTITDLQKKKKYQEGSVFVKNTAVHGIKLKIQTETKVDKCLSI
jgi:hypothetical protein